MKAQYISTLVAIADAGSIREAAAALNKTQPALTKVLKQAEEDLGVSIFARSSTGVVPTELGRKILVRARFISKQLQELDDEVAQIRGLQTGAVSICLSPLAAVKIVPPAMARFRRSYPNIKINLLSGLYPGAINMLREGRVDMVVGPIPASKHLRDIAVEEIVQTPISVITSRTSKVATSSSLGDLTDSDWIMIGATEGPGDIFAQPFEANGFEVPTATITSESYFGAMSLVQSLGAVCTFPTMLLAEVQRGWDIVETPIRETIEPLRIGLMTRSGQPLTPAGDTLHKFIGLQAKRLSEL